MKITRIFFIDFCSAQSLSITSRCLVVSGPREAEKRGAKSKNRPLQGHPLNTESEAEEEVLDLIRQMNSSQRTLLMIFCSGQHSLRVDFGYVFFGVKK